MENLEISIPESDEKIQEWTEKISKPYNDYIDKSFKEYEQLESKDTNFAYSKYDIYTILVIKSN